PSRKRRSVGFELRRARRPWGNGTVRTFHPQQGGGYAARTLWLPTAQTRSVLPYSHLQNRPGAGGRAHGPPTPAILLVRAGGARDPHLSGGNGPRAPAGPDRGHEKPPHWHQYGVGWQSEQLARPPAGSLQSRHLAERGRDPAGPQSPIRRSDAQPGRP